MKKLKKLYNYGGDIYGTTKQKRKSSDQEGQAVLDGVSSIPGIGTAIGAFASVGTGIGAATKDENGKYDSKGGEVIDNAVNPLTHYAMAKDLFSEDASIDSYLNTFSGGIFGESVADTQRKRAEEAEKNRLNSIALKEGNAKLQAANDGSVNKNQIYAKYGGNINKYVDGGNLKELSDGSAEVEGASHEEGGVQLSPEVEVEGGETLQGLNSNEPFVFSEELGFAQLHKPIAKAIGKMENKIPNTITNNSIRILKQKEEALKMQQEEFKEQLGLKELSQYAYGGRVPQNSKTKDSSKFIVVDNKLIRIKR